MRSVSPTSTSPSSRSTCLPESSPGSLDLGSSLFTSGKGGKPLLPPPPPLHKKQPQRELTCPRPMLKPSGSHFLPLLPLLHPQETEAESRSYFPGQMRRLAWATGSHALHWDVFRHPNTCVHLKCPLPLRTCRQVSWDTRRGNLCQGHRALAQRIPALGRSPHTRRARSPHKRPRTALRPDRPRCPGPPSFPAPVPDE